VAVIRGRLRRRGGKPGEGAGGEEEYVEIEPGELTGVFAAPSWLRDAGLTSWLLVGVFVLVVGIVWLLALTEVIVLPLITAGIVAAVGSPLVAWLRRHRLPRALGAALVMVGIIALGAGIFVLILAGVASESSEIGDQLSDASGQIAGWLKDAGVDSGTADQAKQDADGAVSGAWRHLLGGIATGISALSSLVFFFALTALSLFFLLKDGPVIRSWAERQMGVPQPVAHVITKRTLGSLRGYFLGVTIVAAYSAVVVGGGALIIGVPLAGTIAAVTFVGGYVPYLGAWAAGAFAVLLALGGGGIDAAIAMAVLQLLANGILQQLVQPFAMGAALGIHPLAVLVVTIAGGALFGAVGLVLAAPVTSAIVRITADLGRAQAEGGGEGAVPSPAPT
jgi:predicted PurR-regulated permease PerM